MIFLTSPFLGAIFLNIDFKINNVIKYENMRI